MKKICVNRKKLITTLCIAIPAAAAAVLLPKAIKSAKHRKYAGV